MSRPARKPEPVDPFLEMLRNLPMGPPETEEEKAIVAASRASGGEVPHEDIEAELEAWRLREGR